MLDAQTASRLAMMFEPPTIRTAIDLEGLASELEAGAPAVTAALRELVRELPPGRGSALELFTATFELAPVCAPYLGVHLFGDESFTRAKLMTGLVEQYRERGIEPSVELPDHLAVVLRSAPRWSAAEWQDLVELCLEPALQKMVRELTQARNPYRHAVSAVLRLVQTDASMSEESHA